MNCKDCKHYRKEKDYCFFLGSYFHNMNNLERSHYFLSCEFKNAEIKK